MRSLVSREVESGMPEAHLGLSIRVDFGIVKEVDTVIPSGLDEVLDDGTFLSASDAEEARKQSRIVSGDRWSNSGR